MEENKAERVVMDYFISFLEGIISFVSPCMLPMLPIYISYFAAGEDNKKKTLVNSIGFVLGFTAVFISLGAFAGTLGKLLISYKDGVNLITGAIIMIFGLNYLGVLNLSFLLNTKKLDYQPKRTGFFSSFLFGVIFSIGWTPCVGAFLGSALMMAASSQNHMRGIIMLGCFSLGLGIPFVFSAILLNRFKRVFDSVKRHYKLINTVSGLLLIIVGIAIMTGMFGRFLSILTF